MKRPRGNRIWRLVAPLSALGLLASACGDDTDRTEAGGGVQNTPEQEEPFDENRFFQDPEAFLGRKVTIGAEVNAVLSPTTFVIARGGWPDLLVIGAQSPGDITEDTVVRVTGTVVHFVIPDIETEFGIDLDDDLFIDYDHEHAVIASSVVVLDMAEGQGELEEITDEYRADLQPLNGSGVAGTAELRLGAGGRLEVRIDGQGFVPAQTHLQHIHMPAGDSDGTCPQPDADTDGDGMVTSVEGERSYGPVALPLDPFPVATDEAEIVFEQQFLLDPGLEPLDQGVVVIHGAEVNGQYDQQMPVACADIE